MIILQCIVLYSKGCQSSSATFEFRGQDPPLSSFLSLLVEGCHAALLLTTWHYSFGPCFAREASALGLSLQHQPQHSDLFVDLEHVWPREWAWSLVTPPERSPSDCSDSLLLQSSTDFALLQKLLFALLVVRSSRPLTTGWLLDPFILADSRASLVCLHH